MQMCRLALFLALNLRLVIPARSVPSIARDWDEQILAAIRIDTPHPPVQARNLFSFSVCMYDAWAAYDTVAVGYVYRGKHAAGEVAAARRLGARPPGDGHRHLRRRPRPVGLEALATARDHQRRGPEWISARTDSKI